MATNETAIWLRRLFWLIVSIIAVFVLLTLLILIASAGLQAA
jgi:lipopolysaccharide/colanic/teichoic acid biosynthesis glycosyltransferase